eukprot:TRINITY_DN16128_c0_g2_i1.p1 TRINITY_DN16128_c0_g2~~TRINITY_DN16128_c0_g2_i1.p1  ORF type:complete len:705 (-),score=90.26 TRINITY_DN16128_c0_g2_i1:449-2491(-)
MAHVTGTVAVHGLSSTSEPSELVYSTVGLSFWGGIDPTCGVVIDHSHPLYGHCIADKILAIPSGRGSCTGSQVMLELILNGFAPKAVLTRDMEVILAVGAIVARETFGEELGGGVRRVLPSIVCVGEDGFQALAASTYAAVKGSAVFHGLTYQDVSTAIVPSIEGNAAPSSDSRDDSELTLTDEEKDILQGHRGEAARIAMLTIVEVAVLSGARRLLPITQAHIDGVTYIGPGGLRFAQALANLGGKVAVPTTLNSSSADRRRWRDLGVPSSLGEAACSVGDAYLQLGCTHSFTCAPYLLDGVPARGEDVAWGESNAVVFANSVLGARTQKYADYLDICAALVGRVPEAGPHLNINRRPGIVLDATSLIERFRSVICNDGIDVGIDALYPALGYLCGNLSDGQVPLILGFENVASSVTTDDLKAFSAAFGTTGSAALFHMAGVTPEAKDVGAFRASCQLDTDSRLKRVKVSVDDLVAAFVALDSGGGGKEHGQKENGGDGSEIDLVALGNPHLSLTECERLARLCCNGDSQDGSSPRKKEKHPNVRIVATLGRFVHAEAMKLGYVSALERFGVQFVNDTCWCMLTEPIIPTDPSAKILTNSGKYAHYAPALVGRRTRFASMAGCVDAAQTGRVRASLPSWLDCGQQHRRFASRSCSSGCLVSLPGRSSIVKIGSQILFRR